MTFLYEAHDAPVVHQPSNPTPEGFKGDWGRKSRPNFALLTLEKLGDGVDEMSEFFLRDL